MAKQIYQYVRNGNKLVGVLMGTKCSDGTVIITSSRCASSKGDVFNKEFGKALCIARAYNYESENRIPTIPASMKIEAMNFSDRCHKYFKTEEVSFYTDVQKI